MISWFDSQQEKLMDEVDPTTNTVGHFIEQIFKDPSRDIKGYASGGDVNDSVSSYDLRNIMNEAKAGTTGADATVIGGRFGDSPLGTGFYNSPAYLASHYTQLGKFFNQSEPGNKYTDRYTTPQKSQVVPSEDPSTFYANWYNRMREFAQAEEVSGAGQAEIRTR